MSVKITLIGAGSVVFAKNLLGDILQFPELSNARIYLMDIDAERLEVAATMTRRMIAQLKIAATVEATLDRREAVRGAKYVICTIQVGGYRPATVIDFKIPKKYGLRQTIGDTLGVGGVFRGLRTIPVLNAIARDIAEVGAPGCLLLNYTNPMAMLCWGVDRGVGIPHVGLCHSVQSTSQRLASYAGVPMEDVTYRVAGINHMAFFLRFDYKGRDAYPLLFRKLHEPGFSQDKVRFEMMRRTGYFVTESSEHQSEYLPYFLPHGEKVVADFDIPLDEYLRRCEAIIDTWEATEKQILGSEGSIEIGPQTHEYGAFIIHSKETNTPRVIYGNVPNRSLITNLPQGCCVEVPVLVDAQGLQPTVIGDLPPQLAALCQSNVSVQGLAVEAALTHRREAIYHAVMADPNAAATLTLDQIWKMCDELIEAHQKLGFLGEFTPVVAETGRSLAGVGDCTIVEAKLDPKNSENILLVAENPGPFTVKFPLELIVKEWNGKVFHRHTMKLVVSGNQRLEKSVPLPLPENRNAGFRVCLENAPQGVLPIDLELRPRRNLAAGGEVPACEISLGGSPAARLWFHDDGELLCAKAEVFDSQITPGKMPWSGSSLELFFAPEGSNSPYQVILVPGEKQSEPKLVTAQAKLVTGALLSQKTRRGSYEIEWSVPKESLRLVATARAFLFDAYANVMALGEAHSGGRGSLSGGFHAHLGTAHFAFVDLHAEPV